MIPLGFARQREAALRLADSSRPCRTASRSYKGSPRRAIPSRGNSAGGGVKTALTLLRIRESECPFLRSYTTFPNARRPPIASASLLPLRLRAGRARKA